MGVVFTPNKTQIALNVIPLTLHLFALYLLIKYRRSYGNINQYMYLLNLSLSELTFVLLGLVSLFLAMFNYHEGSHRVEAIQYSTVTIVCFVAMIYLTVDRFLEVRLNIFYPLHENLALCNLECMWFA